MYPPSVERFVNDHRLARATHITGTGFGDLQSCFVGADLELRVTSDRGRWLLEVRHSSDDDWLPATQLLRFLKGEPPAAPPVAPVDIEDLIAGLELAYEDVVLSLRDPTRKAEAYEYERQVSAAFAAALFGANRSNS